MTVPYRLTLAGRRVEGADGPSRKRPCGIGRKELERLQRNAAELGGVVIYDGRNAWVGVGGAMRPSSAAWSCRCSAPSPAAGSGCASRGGGRAGGGRA